MLDVCPTHRTIMHIGCMYRTRIGILVRGYDDVMTCAVLIAISRIFSMSSGGDGMCYGSYAEDDSWRQHQPLLFII
ncbi:hypothetical protein Hsc_3130 [Herbaspirillum seropedicae]|nr:hypothetical protein Hsc_3130 [Herbaspirillum seropedicae]